MRPRLRLLHWAAGAALFAALALPLPAQSKGAAPTPDQERAARGQELLDQNSGGPNLIAGPNGEPILRYPVAHQHAATGCLGYLYISRDTMRYEVLFPEQDKDHAFERRRSDLTTAQQWRFWGTSLPEAEFKFSSGGTFHFFHVRNRILQSQNTKFSWGDVLPYQDLIDGAQKFDDIVAVLKAREAPPPAPAAPPPTISLLEPAGAEEGKTVPAYETLLHVRGIASQASGIASVSVNGQSAFFKPLAPQTVEFDLRDLQLSSGMSAVVVVATGSDKSVSQMTFKVSRSEVRVLEPGAGSEMTDAAVRVRGLAVGFRDVDKVDVAGQPATLRRREDGSVEFEAASVPLNIGPNTLQGSVVGSSGQRQDFSVAVVRKPPAGPPPLTLDEVEAALTSGLPKSRIATLANQYGVDFEMTDAADKRLRGAGADSALLLDLVKAYKGAAKPKPAVVPSPPPARSTPPPAPAPVKSTPSSTASPPQTLPPPASSPAPATAVVAAAQPPTAAQPAAQAAPLPPPAPKPLPPLSLRVIAPDGVEEGKSVETANNALRGTATHGSGISAVLVNDKPAALTKLSTTTTEFDVSNLSLSEAWTPLTVVARSVDGTQSRLTFKLSHPAVRWLNPPNGRIETASAAILAQGEAVGFNGVDKVELAGTSPSLEKMADGGVEFHAVLPLALGQNTFQGTVVGSSGFRLAFQLEVRRIAASAQDSNQK